MNGLLIATTWCLIGFQKRNKITKSDTVETKTKLRRPWTTRTHTNLSPTSLRSKMRTPSSVWTPTLFKQEGIQQTTTMKHVKNPWSNQVWGRQLTFNTVFWSSMINSSTSKRSSSFLSMVLESMWNPFVTTASTASKQSRRLKKTSRRTSENANTISSWWIATCRSWTAMNRPKRLENTCMPKTFISQSLLQSQGRLASKMLWNVSRAAWIKLQANHWNQMLSRIRLSIWTISKIDDLTMGGILNN